MIMVRLGETRSDRKEKKANTVGIKVNMQRLLGRQCYGDKGEIYEVILVRWNEIWQREERKSQIVRKGSQEPEIRIANRNEEKTCEVEGHVWVF